MKESDVTVTRGEPARGEPGFTVTVTISAYMVQEACIVVGTLHEQADLEMLKSMMQNPYNGKPCYIYLLIIPKLEQRNKNDSE